APAAAAAAAVTATAPSGNVTLPAATSESNFTSSMSLTAGLKFPTGDSSRLQEEFNEKKVEGAPPSGIHGHDLALGSGSWDGIFGLRSFTRYKSLFFDANVQYPVRSTGDHSFRYGNSLVFNVAPGVYLHRSKDQSVGLECSLFGERESASKFRGQF